MIINDMFIRLENEAIMMLIQSDKEKYDILLEQYQNSTVKERWFSGSGFFTEYLVPSHVRRLEGDKKPIGTVCGKLIGLDDIEVGFLLFFKDGVINTLECHEWDDVDFPQEIEAYQLSYDSSILNP